MVELKISSWNVNGLRSVVNKGFRDFIKTNSPDILCLQEIKMQSHQNEDNFGYSSVFINSAQKKGYSGVMILSKIKPLNVFYGIGIEEHDKEGRVITLEFDNCFIVNVYTPNSQRGLLRLDYRQRWDIDFRNYIFKLNLTKPVIFCGDLNVAHKEIDLKNPSQNHKNAGFTIEERSGFSKIVEDLFIDTFRYFYPEKVKYTWWSYMYSARQKNVGWRIDYFIVSKQIIKYITDSIINDDVIGSDHCPVTLKIDYEAVCNYKA